MLSPQAAPVMDAYQQFIHVSRYSRWRDDLGRRETWAETVQRYVDYFDAKTNHAFTSTLQEVIKPAIQNLDDMPSMRALMTAGEALDRENIAGYNCAYLAVNSKRSFSEALYILMCGTGVGFSCEKADVNKLPVIPDELTQGDDIIVVADSKEGWAKAYNRLLGHLWDGDIPTVDYSRVRPAGERLKVFGGRASGPEPLRRLFEFTVSIFKRASGRKLKPIEVHDIMCTIGEIVVVGGVRRSALISLSDLSDSNLAGAKGNFNVDQYSLINETATEWVYTVTMKKNQPVNPTYRVSLLKAKQDWVRDMLEVQKQLPWFILEPQRGLANNSVAYDKKPDATTFLAEWLSLVKSQSGERGIFNREAAQKQASRWGRRSPSKAYGCNPCSEILLLDKQFCNLTEVVIRAHDTLETLLKKVEVATIMGTFQATLTKFGFISETWTKNTIDEALLGVSLTGIMDNLLMSGSEGHDKLRVTLNTLRDHARAVNAEWAQKLGIKPAAAITCVKPSGTVSQLCNTSSGIHARHNLNYIRTVRIDKKDPLYHFMVAEGFVVEDDNQRPQSTAIVSFPMSAPPNAITRDKVSAIEALELWLLYQREWCEHKPSVTVSVRDSEWLEVGAWVYKNFDEVSGISFLPMSEHTYEQAPYQDLTPQKFAEWSTQHPLPPLDWTKLSRYEKTDTTTSSQTLACVGGVCELPNT